MLDGPSRFPEGTVVLKELVSVGSNAMPSGNGYFQGDFVSLEAMVKDTKRFKEEPGGWAFFRFGEAPHYKPVGARMKTADCAQCHTSATEDYVFTATYPVLRAAKAKLTAKQASIARTAISRPCILWCKAIKDRQFADG